MSTTKFRPHNTCALCKRSWAYPDPKHRFCQVFVDYDGTTVEPGEPREPFASRLCDDCWVKQPADIIKRADFPGIRKWFRSPGCE